MYKQKKLTCTVCGDIFYRKKAFSNPKCKPCSKKVYNKRKRIKRQMEPPESTVKRKARFYGTLTEDDIRKIDHIDPEDLDDPNEPVYKQIDETHAQWDFVAGKRGRGKNDIGFEQIGTVTERDLDVIMIDGQPRVKAMIELERRAKKSNRK